jgi:hypothetical protein
MYAGREIIQRFRDCYSIGGGHLGQIHLHLGGTLAAITDAFRGVGGSFFALPSSWQMSKLAEPTVEGPDSADGDTG